MNHDDIDKNSDRHVAQFHDPQLHDEAISALYRQLPDETPSSGTDDLIRATARRATGSAPQKKGFTARLQGLLATAAMLVLGVALLAQWQREPEKLQEMVAMAPARESTATPEAPAPAAARKPSPVLAPEKRKADSAEKFRHESGTTPRTEPAARDSARQTAIGAAPAPTPALQQEAAAPAAAPDLAPPARLAERDEAEQAQLRQRARLEASLKKERLGENSQLAARNLAAAPAISMASPLPYQQAMQEERWQDAEALLAAVDKPGNSPQALDGKLLALLQEKPAVLDCQAFTGGEALLCRFMSLHKQGKPLPDDALAQLEKSGAVSGEFAYRRQAVAMLFPDIK